MLMIAPEVTDPFDVISYSPQAMTRRAAERARRLALPRERVAIAPGWTLMLSALPDEELWQESGQAIEVDLRIDGETVKLRSVWPALETFLYQAEPCVRIDDLDAELVAALIETHAIERIEALEALLGTEVAIERVSKSRDHADLARLDLGLSVNGSQDQYPAAIFGSPGVLGMLAAAWERSARLPSAVDVPPFILAARVATSSVSRAGLRGLATGDALLFDRVAPDGGIVLCLGEHLTAAGEITETGAVSASVPFAPTTPLLLGDFLMSDNDYDAEGGTKLLDEASVGSLPVRMVFEIGRREMSLDELKQLGVGAPIALEKPASSVVDILANGRRIGAGEMVLIGDQLGVRITRLNGHA